MDLDELLVDLDDWCMVQPRAAKAIRTLRARVTELEVLLNGGVEIALLDDWDQALTGRQLWLKDAIKALEGREK